MKLGAVLEERRAVGVGLHAGGLVPRRPDVAALDVPQEDVRSPGVARGVLAPPCDGQVVAAAVARAGHRQHHHVSAIGEEVRPGRRMVRRRVLAEDGLHEIGDVGPRLDLVHGRADDGHVPRGALLQEQIRGLDDGFAVEARAHRAGAQDIQQRHEGHPLVVRHVGPHDGDRAALGKSRSRVVERLVESIRAPPALRDEAGQVARGGHGVDHGGQRAGIGRHDQILAEAPLEAQARDAEVRVLIGQIQIADVVGGFGDPPGDAALDAVAHVTADHQVIGLVEQAAGRGVHDERGHQVLEHRAGPGHERRSESDGGHRAAEPEPVGGGNLTLGDRDETGEPRLGGEEIVLTGIEAAVGDAVADRENPAHRIEEKAERHRVEEFLRALRGGAQAADEVAGRAGGALQGFGDLFEAADFASAARPFAGPGPAEGGQFGQGRLAAVGQVSGRGSRGHEALGCPQGLGGSVRVIGQGRLEVGRPGHDGREVTLVARDGGAHGSGPDHDVGVRVLVALGHQGARDVHERVGLNGEATETGGAVGQARRGARGA